MTLPSDSPSRPAPSQCPECGAQLAGPAAECWLCHALVVITAEIVPEPSAPPIVPEWQRRQSGKPMPFQFSIETLLLVTTLVAVCLGASLAVPGLGIPVSIIAVPALIRTLVASHQQRSVGHKLSLVEKVLTFLASTGVMIAVVAAGGAAFFATCTVALLAAAGIEQAGGQGGQAFEAIIMPGLILSTIAGLAVASWIFWITRPRKPRW